MMSTHKLKGGSRDKERHNRSFFADLCLPNNKVSGNLRSSKSLAQFASGRKGSNVSASKAHLESPLFKLRSKSQSRVVKHNTATSKSDLRSLGGKKTVLENIYSTEKTGAEHQARKSVGTDSRCMRSASNKHVATSTKPDPAKVRRDKKSLSGCKYRSAKTHDNAQNSSLLFAHQSSNKKLSTSSSNLANTSSLNCSRLYPHEKSRENAANWSIKDPKRLAESLKRHFLETEKNAEPELVINVTDTTAHTASNVKTNEELVKCAEKAKSFSSDMLSAIKTLGKQCGNTDSQEFFAKKEQLLMAQFNEIIGNDPFFGELLRHFKEICDHARQERDLLAKQRLETELSRKKEVALIEAQKSAISGLKLQLGSSVKELARYKRRYHDLAGMEQKFQEMAEELASANEENEHLVRLLKKIYNKSDKEFESPAPEPALEHDHKFPPFAAGNHNKFNRSVLEVGKKRVKIPVLDFTKLPPGKPSKLTVVKYGSGPDSSSVGNSNGTLVLEQELEGSSENGEGQDEKMQEMLHNLIESAGDVGQVQRRPQTP